MESDGVSLLIIVFCIIMSAYFSATETAFSSLNRIRIKNMAEKGNKKAALVMRLSENYDSLLSTILIGNNIVNIASASMATVLFVKFLGNDAGPSVSTLVTTIVVLIFGEVSPKSIAKESPEKFAMFSAGFLRILVVLLTPANFLFGQWKKILSAVFKTEGDRSVTEEELLTIVEEAEQEGGIDEQEGTLIRSALEFTELTAIDVLTPRVDMAAVSVEASVEEIAQVFYDSGYSRLPVYENTLDEIVGILYQKDFFQAVSDGKRKVTEVLRPAHFIARTKKIGVLLKELQRQKLHIAVVVDEFGGTLGLVTLEDILEELVGEIWDEHDTVVEEIHLVSEQVFQVLGGTNIDKLYEALGREADFDVQTVSGWVMEQAGQIPKEGDQFVCDGLEVKVLKMAGKRIELVQVAAI